MHRCLDGEASTCVTSLGLNEKNTETRWKMASCMLICGSTFRWQTSEHGLPGTSIFFPNWLHTSEACSKHCSFNGFQLRPRSSVWWNPLASAVDIRGDKIIVKLQRLEFMLFFLSKNNELVLSQRSIWHPSIWGLETRWTFGGWSWTGVAWPSNCVTWVDIFNNFLGICCRNRNKSNKSRWFVVCFFFFADSGCITNMSWSVVRRRISWNGKLMV